MPYVCRNCRRYFDKIMFECPHCARLTDYDESKEPALEAAGYRYSDGKAAPQPVSSIPVPPQRPRPSVSADTNPQYVPMNQAPVQNMQDLFSGSVQTASNPANVIVPEQSVWPDVPSEVNVIAPGRVDTRPNNIRAEHHLFREIAARLRAGQWGRLLVILLGVAVFVAIIMNLDKILSGILSATSALLPTILTLALILYAIYRFIFPNGRKKR